MIVTRVFMLLTSFHHAWQKILLRCIHLMHHLDANESIDCLHCEKTFNSKQNFASHLRRHHGKLSEYTNRNDTTNNSGPVLIPEQMDCEDIADNISNNFTESD